MPSDQAASKRPRLSLQIKNLTTTGSRISKALAIVDPKDQTAFNTLSNVYVTAIERSTPVQASPLTAINTWQMPRKQTVPEVTDLQHRIQTPLAASYPQTPLTANPISPTVSMEIAFPSTMTATPPLSAGPTETNGPDVFTFAAADTKKLSINTNLTNIAAKAPPTEARTPRRRALSMGTSSTTKPPYSHPHSLHSILRNSPLVLSGAIPPPSPRRQSLRLQEKAARRVAYNSPLTQTITTSRYVKSHIDLLCEEASPNSPSLVEPDSALDLALAFTADETRDGGQTPGPFEEMRRRMASLGTSTPISPAGIRKRKRKEKKRRWVWTIGQEDGDEEPSGSMLAVMAANAAAAQATKDCKPDSWSEGPQMYLETPTPTIESQDSGMESMDVEMSDTSSFISEDRALTPGDMDLDLRTPVAGSKNPSPDSPPMVRDYRLGSVDLINPDTGSRRDTPVPPDLIPLS